MGDNQRTKEMHDMLNDLNNDQAMMYNNLIGHFNEVARRLVRPNGHLRLGQAFYNYGHDAGIFKGSFPELFYCEDNNKAQWMIVDVLCAYVKDKTC